ncbi:MAG: hypothetical protein V3T05_14590, partial [Myxococcota bacterium]
ALGTGGTALIGCTSVCTWDLSVCTGGNSDICAALGWYDDGFCDPCTTWGGDADFDDCTAACAADNACGDYWFNGAWICMSETGAADPDCGICGNGTADDAEFCDGTDLRSSACTDAGFTGGTLACTLDCVYDFTSCTTTAAVCNNNAIELPEICDGTDLAGLDCTDLGFSDGDLDCKSDCTDFDTANCTGAPTCGNDIVEFGEECEPPSVGNCDASCQYIGSPSMTSCGDNIMNGVDYCDGADFGPSGTPTCNDILGIGGTTLIGCAADCTWNLSACTGGDPDICTALGWYNDGFCDPCAIWGGSPDTADCTAACASDGSCGDYWFNGEWACASETTLADPDCGTCGNSSLDGAEYCDGTDLGANPDCTDWGYTGGVLTCLSDCEPDFRACTSLSVLCGDGNIDVGEICDSTNVAGMDCVDFGYTGGRLGCETDCSDFDLTGCTGTLCGDNTTDAGEVCDGSDTGSTTCSTLGFTGGTIGCLPDCSNFDTTGCTGGPVCGNGVVEFGEDCDPPDGLTCDTNCRRITLPICGNGIVELGEQCDPPDGTTCDNACQAIGTTNRANGSPCTADGNCAGGKCLTEATFGQPGGYCTSDCSSNACDATEECIAYGGGDAWCSPTCASITDCRFGYSCIDGFAPRPFCTPDCHLNAECTETDLCDVWSGYCDIDDGLEHDGGACTSDVNGLPIGCESQFWCVDDATFGWPSGYCLSMCSLETGMCPGDGVCLPSFTDVTFLGACYDGCLVDGDCRTDYTCQTGICLPGSSVGPVCGNDDIELGEECDPPNGTTCDSNCMIIPDVCGNGIIEITEECEPPSVGNCDADCLLTGGGRLNGDACTGNGACAGNVCLTEASDLWPGGFCTEDCTPGSCGAGEECVDFGGTIGPVCMLSCISLADCFPGYACFDGLGTIQPICFPECNDDAECTDGGSCDVWNGFCDINDNLALDGEACTIDDDCESQFDCLQPADGFRGGYCVSACSPELDLCPGDGFCVNAYGLNLLWACIDGCTTDSGCRQDEGYTCQFGLCLPGGGGPACGNGILDVGEQCDPPDGVTCDANCQNIVSVCGNGILEAGEECDPPDGSTCGTTCQLLGDNRVNGDACIQNSECTGGVCLTEATDLWPGGFCTKTCTLGSCAGGEECMDFGTDSYCMLTCAGFLDCFPGYSCLDGFGTVDPICWPDCQLDAECTDTGLCDVWNGFCDIDDGWAHDGGACTSDSDGLPVGCESEFFCVDEATYGFPGGYCLSACALDTGLCPGNGVCDDSFGLTLTGACYAGCATDNDCRVAEGYICVSGMCLP